MRENRETRVPGAVRQGDVEPYTGLRWVSWLFKAAAVFLVVALVGEFIAGLRFEGMGSLAELLGEAARTLVVAVVLWAGGDLVRLLVDVGHDIRAERILLARVAGRMPAREVAGAAPGDAGEAPGNTVEEVRLRERGAAD